MGRSKLPVKTDLSEGVGDRVCSLLTRSSDLSENRTPWIDMLACLRLSQWKAERVAISFQIRELLFDDFVALGNFAEGEFVESDRLEIERDSSSPLVF